jgi:hypothetical protein
MIDASGTLGKPNLTKFRSRLRVEDLLVTGVLDWARKLGLVSYRAVKKRDSNSIPRHGQFGWDITGPSYVRPLSTYTQGRVKPGFFVADVAYCEVDKNQILYFLQKCSTTRAIKTMKPFLAFLVAERFSREAFDLGKQSGLILTTPEILFGKVVADSLKALATTLENAANVVAANPERVGELMNSLSSIEGAAINLRGALFELIVGHLVLKGEGSSIDLGVTVVDPESAKSAEMDVRRSKGDHEVAVYECKGLQPHTKVSLADVDKWLGKKIPIIRSSLLSETRFRSADFTFEYWTSGRFAVDALTRLHEAQSQTKKYTINWRDGVGVLRYAREKKLRSMVKVLKEHFTDHPLAQNS